MLASKAVEPAARSSQERGIVEGDARWYQDAVVYQVHLRAFRDADGDGIGDLRGLIERLDYLQDLGITALWLLPFYPSPLRDDGYDIADYKAVHPDYGTLEDVRALIEQAHLRGLRVITELVCNHTSDQHAWFQRARRAPPGSPERDFYVWRPDNAAYRDARIIFKDFEASNWAWDPLAKAYYWHRFYAHQPDLNFDHPPVRAALLDVVDFWFAMGVDGLRLDAVPYLYEEEGTSCENLPRTHAFLRRLRRHVEERFPGRMLLAEANQWPEDAAAYFGAGDECHMAFHFPLMPRLFMSLRMEDRSPIVDILAQTPEIPATAQWAIFLRNHDELTLEMVTDEERDYMYRAYAEDVQARINLGIRRRLAPLLRSNRRRIELMNALLFSLPGTPVIYYGDELGMGDNIYLGDRNGVRTPMQWNPNRNAGFSDANRQRLFLPVIVDPEYHYESVNVETQQQNPASLLWWTKRLIALRRRSQAFGRGTLEFLQPDNYKVLAFLRCHEQERVLVVANLSRFAQCAQLDLSALRGMTPVEMMGRVPFPAIGEGPYQLSLGPHSFYWFSLQPAETPAASGDGQAPAALPTLWRGGPGWLEKGLPAVLLPWLQARRWFSGKGQQVKSVRVRDDAPLGSNGHLCQVEVDFADADAQVYSIPLTLAEGEEGEHTLAHAPHTVVARVEGARGRPGGVLVDGLTHEPTCAALLEVIARRRTLRGSGGEARGVPTPALGRLLSEAEEPLAPLPASFEQSNSAVTYGGRVFLKLLRRIEPGQGANPDLEVTRFLSEREFAHAPRLLGSLDWSARRGDPTTMAIAYELVQSKGDGWTHVLEGLERCFERLLASKGEPPPGDGGTLLELAQGEPPAALQEAFGELLGFARLLGERSADLHRTLGSSSDDPRFAPEPFTSGYQRSLYQSLRNQVVQATRRLRQRFQQLPEPLRPLGRRVLDQEQELLGQLRPLVDRRLGGGARIRIHGDYHLGQVLHTGMDLMIFDFEGEPSRSLGERRLKHTPMRDVAGMLRSFHYAAVSALRRRLTRPQDAAAVEPWARSWYRWSAATFLRAYLEGMRGTTLLPPAAEDQALLLEAHLLGKACYELGYELSNRPDWVGIPLEGVAGLLPEAPP